MVSVAVSKLGYTHFIFVKDSTYIDGAYRGELLMNKLLPDTRSTAGKVRIFEQHNTTAYRARQTGALVAVWESAGFAICTLQV